MANHILLAQSPAPLLPPPVGGIEKRTGGTKCIHHASRQKKFTEGSNEIRKRTVINLITKFTRGE